MGLAWVQNDCKTKWIPNIWKNEEKGRVTCKALAPADVWVPLCLPRGLGAGWAGGVESRRRDTQLCLRQLLSRCEREGTGFSKSQPEWSERVNRADQVDPLTSVEFKPTSEILKDIVSFLSK